MCPDTGTSSSPSSSPSACPASSQLVNSQEPSTESDTATTTTPSTDAKSLVDQSITAVPSGADSDKPTASDCCSQTTTGSGMDQCPINQLEVVPKSSSSPTPEQLPAPVSVSVSVPVPVSGMYSMYNSSDQNVSVPAESSSQQTTRDLESKTSTPVLVSVTQVPPNSSLVVLPAPSSAICPNDNVQDEKLQQQKRKEQELKQLEEDRRYAQDFFHKYSHLDRAQCLSLASSMSEAKFAPYREQLNEARSLWHLTSQQIHKLVNKKLLKKQNSNQKPTKKRRNVNARPKNSKGPRRGSGRQLTTTIIEISDDDDNDNDKDRDLNCDTDELEEELEALDELDDLDEEIREKNADNDEEMNDKHCLEEYKGPSSSSTVPTSSTGPIVTNIITQIGPNHNKILKSKSSTGQHKLLLPSETRGKKRPMPEQMSFPATSQSKSGFVPVGTVPSCISLAPPPPPPPVPVPASVPSPAIPNKYPISMNPRSGTYFGQPAAAPVAAPTKSAFFPPKMIRRPLSSQQSTQQQQFVPPGDYASGNSNNSSLLWHPAPPYRPLLSFPNRQLSQYTQHYQPQQSPSLDSLNALYYPDHNNNNPASHFQSQPLLDTASSAYCWPQQSTPYPNYPTASSSVNSAFRPSNSNHLQFGSTVHWMNNSNYATSVPSGSSQQQQQQQQHQWTHSPSTLSSYYPSKSDLSSAMYYPQPTESNNSDTLPSFNEVRSTIHPVLNGPSFSVPATTTTGTVDQFGTMDPMCSNFGNNNEQNGTTTGSHQPAGTEIKSIYESDNDLEMLNSLIMSLQSDTDFTL